HRRRGRRGAAGRAQAGPLQLVRLRRPQRLPRVGSGHLRQPSSLLDVSARRSGAVEAGIRDLDGRNVGWFRLDGGPHRGAIGTVEGQTIEQLVRVAADVGVPVLGVLATSGAEVHEGVAALHAWGRVARALSAVSGVVPVVLVVVGPCVSGPALLLGMADVVVMTTDAFAYVSGPDAVASMTGVQVTHERLGGAGIHGSRSGVAALMAPEEQVAINLALDVLSFLAPNNMELPHLRWTDDSPDREVAATVPASPTASYDVRAVVADVA